MSEDVTKAEPAAEGVSEDRLRKAEAYVEAEDGVVNRLVGWAGTLVTSIAVTMSLFHLYAAIAGAWPFTDFPIITTQPLRYAHVAFVMMLCFLLFPMSARFRNHIRWWDVVAGITGAAILIYAIEGGEEFTDRATMPTHLDVVLGVVFIVLLLEATRRTTGWIVPCVAMGFPRTRRDSPSAGTPVVSLKQSSWTASVSARSSQPSSAMRSSSPNEGRVDLEARSTDIELLVSVRDTGPGIPEDQQEAIFEEFRQAGADVRGTGLGLAISRRLARAMGGDITLEQRAGPGQRLRRRLPLDSRNGRPALPDPEPTRTRRRRGASAAQRGRRPVDGPRCCRRCWSAAATGWWPAGSAGVPWPTPGDCNRTGSCSTCSCRERDGRGGPRRAEGGRRHPRHPGDRASPSSTRPTSRRMPTPTWASRSTSRRC